MLKAARIRNFQSHKDTSVEFVPGTNVIIGASDTGKSALFRAINWVCTNRPLGDSFRSEWGGDTSVVLETTDGHTVERVKGATRNEYIVDGLVLKAFGAEVPDEVTEALQIDEAGISSQMDPPFLLAATPGEAARQLNTAASIDVIDRSISKLKKEHGRVDNEVKRNLETLEGYKEQMTGYGDIPMLEMKLQFLENADLERKERQSDLALMDKAYRQGRLISEQLAKSEYIPEAATRLEGVEALHRQYGAKHAIYAALAGLANTISAMQGNLAKTAGIEGCITKYKALDKTSQAYSGKSGKLTGLKAVSIRVKGHQQTMNRLDRELAGMREQYKTIAPETCPLCGGPWEGDEHEG